MPIQLDERPAQFLTPPTNRNETPGRSRPWMVPAVVIAAITLGAGLLVAVARPDGARSPGDTPASADASDPGVDGGVLPAHLEEFEARVNAGSTAQIVQDDIDAALAELQEA